MNFEQPKNPEEIDPEEAVISTIDQGREVQIPSEQEDVVDFESLEALPMYEGEQPEEYLMRVYEMLIEDADHKGEPVSLIKGLNLALQPQYQSFYNKTLKYVRDMCRDKEYQNSLYRKFDEERMKDEFEKIRSSITYSSNYGRIDEDEMITFEHTNQNRSFFGKTRRLDNIPYCQSLFCVGSESTEAVEYIKDNIENKNVALLGGGYSAEDLIIRGRTILPKSVVNIDPYIRDEKVEKGNSYPYISIPIRVDDTEILQQELQARDLGPFDEMWASFSVPYYLNTPEELEGMFETITNNLAEGGIARIFPLSIGEDQDSMDTYEEFLLQIKNLMYSPDFNIYTTHGAMGTTLYIRKLKTVSRN
jgi:hypothetical protein